MEMTTLVSSDCVAIGCYQTGEVESGGGERDRSSHGSHGDCIADDREEDGQTVPHLIVRIPKGVSLVCQNELRLT